MPQNHDVSTNGTRSLNTFNTGLTENDPYFNKMASSQNVFSENGYHRSEQNYHADKFNASNICPSKESN